MNPVQLKPCVAILTVLVATAVPALAADPPPLKFEDTRFQAAERSDMAVMAPYMGLFRSQTHTSQADGRQFYFTVRYQWYDAGETIVKYTLTTHFPDSGEQRPLGEGFYYYDPFAQRIAVYGAFRDGRSGAGFLSPFDAQSHAREVRIRARRPDGAVVEVRDTFWIIDEDSWGNRTLLSRGGQPWQAVSEGVYTRVREGST